MIGDASALRYAPKMKISTFEAIAAELNASGVRFVTVATLIAMKELAGRPRDRDDVEHLRMILDEQKKR